MILRVVILVVALIVALIVALGGLDWLAFEEEWAVRTWKASVANAETARRARK